MWPRQLGNHSLVYYRCSWASHDICHKTYCWPPSLGCTGLYVISYNNSLSSGRKALFPESYPREECILSLACWMFCSTGNELGNMEACLSAASYIHLMPLTHKVCVQTIQWSPPDIQGSKRSCFLFIIRFLSCTDGCARAHFLRPAARSKANCLKKEGERVTATISTPISDQLICLSLSVTL